MVIMSWLQLVRCCAEPNVKEFTSQSIIYESQQDGGQEGVGPCALASSLAKDIGVATTNCDQTTRTILDGFSEVHVCDVPAAAPLRRRRSSSSVDALATLAEDDAVMPLHQGALEDVNRTESHWSEPCRSSCSTLVARGCSSVAYHEPTGGIWQPTARLHQVAMSPKDSTCASPVSAAVGRSAASPMRHDFMTLMRQGSNRGSSSGVVHETTGSTAPAPHPWSPARPVDGFISAAGEICAPTRDRADSATQQTHCNEMLALALAIDPLMQQRRYRRTSAYAVTAAAVCPATVTDSGVAGFNPLPCAEPSEMMPPSFARCSSSPNIRPGVLQPSGTCDQRVLVSMSEARLAPFPYTAPPSVSPSVNATSSGACYAGLGGASGAEGRCSRGRGGKLPLAAPVLHGAYMNAERNGASEQRQQPLQQTTMHSPLRPRDLPPPPVASASLGPSLPLPRAAAFHSTSGLPKHTAAGSSGNGLVRRPASGTPGSDSSYQHIRLLQQLREQHESNHQLRHQQQANMAVAANAASVAAVAVTTGVGHRVAIRPCTTAGDTTVPIRWVESASDCTFLGSSAAASSGATKKPSAATSKQRNTTALSVATAVGMAVSGAKEALENPACSLDKSMTLAECTDMLLLEGGSGVLPSITALLTPILRSQCADRCCTCSGGGDSWAAAGDSDSGRDRPASKVPLQCGGHGAVGAVPSVSPAPAAGVGDSNNRNNSGAGRGGSSSSGRCGALSVNGSARPGVLVNSLGEVLSIATGTASTEHRATGVPAIGGDSQAVAEAAMVIENLLHGNGLPDDGLSVQLDCVAAHDCDCVISAASNTFDVFDNIRHSVGDDRIGRHGAGNGHGIPRAPAFSRTSESHLAAMPLPDNHHQYIVDAAPTASHVSDGTAQANRPSAWAPGRLFRGGVDGGGVGGNLSPGAFASPEAILLRLSRTGSPAPESLLGSAPISGAAMFISPQLSERATPAAAPSSGACSKVSLLPASPSRFPPEAATEQSPSICSPSPSHLLDTTPPSTPVSQGPRSSTSARRLYGHPSGVCSTGIRSLGGMAISTGKGTSIAPKGNLTQAGTAGSSGSAAVHSNVHSELTDRRRMSLAVSELHGEVVQGGSSGYAPQTRGEVGGRRVSSVLASESSLAAIALLRSAATNCTLPDDNSVGAGSSSMCFLNHCATGTVNGGSWMGLDADVGVTTTASQGEPVSTICTSQSQPLTSLFNLVAWPPPPSALSPRLLQSPSTWAGEAAPPPLTSVVHQQEETTSLRLEDGLVADPVLLVDGLGSLSYVTSGAYAAVFRGTFEGVPVGIKFLASKSLDLKSPAVKEALLGPGLAHDNIIRTYTTRVARVDACAVGQLRAMAAAMSAGAALQRKRNARRYSTSAAVACSLLSVTSTQLFAPHGSCLTATEMTHCCSPVTTAAPVRVGANSLSTAYTAQGHPASRPTPPMTPPAVATACVVPRDHSSEHSLASRAVQPHLPLQSCLAKGPLMLPRKYAGDASQYPPSKASAAQAELAAGTEGGGMKGGMAVLEHAGRSAAPVEATGGSSLGGSAADSPKPAQHIFIRKSISENARSRMAGYDADAAASNILPTTAAPLLPPRHIEARGSADSSSSPGFRVSQERVRRASVLQLQDRHTAMMPRMSVSPSLTSLPLLDGAVPRGRLGMPVPGAAVAPHTGGSAAERMLDVLRTLGVVGPTDQPTADAHYVTAVVMEFADAGNLDSFSRTSVPCDLCIAVDLLRQVSCGLSYLHAHGLVHGDIKPANVLLLRNTASGRLVAKVADFGLSGLSGQVGTSGGADTCGTVAYSAPERLGDEDGGAADQASDVYSFGICMHQLVSGERPFADLTFAQIMFSVLCLKMRPPWPEGKCGALKPLYEMCCDPAPEKRPNFDQVVTCLDSLWMRLETSRPQ